MLRGTSSFGSHDEIGVGTGGSEGTGVETVGAEGLEVIGAGAGAAFVAGAGAEACFEGACSETVSCAFEIDEGSCAMLLGTCLGVLDLVVRGGMVFIMER